MPLGVLLDTFERPTMRWLLAIKATTTTWWCFAGDGVLWYGMVRCWLVVVVFHLLRIAFYAERVEKSTTKTDNKLSSSLFWLQIEMQSILTKLFPLSERKTKKPKQKILKFFKGLQICKTNCPTLWETTKTVFDTSMERIDFMRMSYKNPNSPHTPRSAAKKFKHNKPHNKTQTQQIQIHMQSYTHTHTHTTVCARLVYIFFP